MKRILSTLTLLLCFAFTAVNAQVITVERAAEIANSFFSAGMQKSAAARGVVASSGLTASFDSNDVTDAASANPTFYVLTNPEGGFVIVSGEETENPIIGYSFDGTIDTGNLPDGFVDYMTDIDAQVRALREYNATNPQKAAAARSAMQRTNYNATSMGNIVKDLKVANFHQEAPFNNLCFTKEGRQASAGCVPIAYAMLCNYYNWPVSATGKGVHSATGETITFGHEYDWNNILDDYSGTYTNDQATAVATLVRDLGYAYQVSYGTGGTGSELKGEGAAILIEQFGFKSLSTTHSSSATYATDRDVYNNDEGWKAIIKDCLNKNYPIPYSAYNTSTKGRHIFMLDGYTDNDYYHFNWGWGDGNGWFTLDNMVPSANKTYTSVHRAYFYLIPNTSTYRVTATATPSNMGTVSINGGTAGSEATADLFSGATATLTAHPAQGYALASWTKGGEIVGSRNTIEVTVGTDGNDYVANFADESTVTIVKDYTISSATGELTNDGTSASKFSQWASTEKPVLRLNATCGSTAANSMSVVNDVLQLYAYDYDKTSGYTYTINAPDGYLITSYSLTYYMSSNFNITVSNGTTTQIASKSDQTLSASGLSTESTSFTLTGTAANHLVKVRSFTVTIQKEGANVPSAPTTYTINVNAENGGNAYVNGTYTSVTVDAGTNVTLQAYPNGANYTFAGWYNGNNLVSSNNPYTFALNSDVTYTAKFNAATYNITAEASPQNAGMVAINGGTQSTVANIDATSGSTVSLQAYPNSGFEFAGWYNGTTKVSSNNPYTITATAAASYIASFQAVQQGGSSSTNLAGKYFRLKQNGTTNYMNIANTSDNTGSTSGVTVVAKNETSDTQVFFFEQSGDGYKLKANSGNYIKCHAWNANANTTSANDATVLTFETTGNELGYLIKWDNTNMNEGVERDDYFKAENGYVYCDAASTKATTWVLEEVKYTINTVASPATVGTATVNGAAEASVSLNAQVELKATVTDNLYKFKNWTLNGVEVSKSATYTVSATANATYTANFEKITYTISVSATEGGSAMIGTGNSTTVEHGASVTLTAQANVGYHFVKWTKGGVEVGTTTECTINNITEAGEYVANFAINTYTVSVSANGTGGNATASATTVEHGASVTLVATPSVGYHFTKWTNGTEDVSEDNPYTFNVTTATTLTANFAINTYTIKVFATEGGSAFIGTETSATVNHDGSVTLTAEAKDGYEFVKWTKGGVEVSTAAEYTINNITEAGEYVANFAINTYTISVSATEGGSAFIGTETNITVEHGTSVTLTATPSAGYSFAGWYNGENLISAEASYTFTVTSDINYTARFEEEAGETPTTCTISIETVDANGNPLTNNATGPVKAVINKGGMDWVIAEDFKNGVKVDLVATSDFNQSAYLFDGWYKNDELVDKAPEITVTVTETATYQARFIKGYVVTLASDNKSWGYPNMITYPDGSPVVGAATELKAVVKPNEEVLISIKPNYGFRVANWTDKDGYEVAGKNVNSFILKITDDNKYTANLEQATYTLTVRANNKGGTVSAESVAGGSGTEIIVGHNMEATITATAYPGHRFVEWTTTDGTPVSDEKTYTVPAIENVEDMVDVEYVAVFEEIGTYYRIAYDFEVPVETPAKSAATRAAGEETITISPATGDVASNVYSSVWNYNVDNNPAGLKIVATDSESNKVTAITASNGNPSKLRFYAGNNLEGTSTKSSAPTTFTLSVNENYVITGYSLRYIVSSANKVTISNEYGYNETPARTYQTMEKTDISVQSITFNVSAASPPSSYYAQADVFTVTIQPVGGETPEPETETVKYYVQSEACGVSGKENALLMTPETGAPETGAASIFYYADNKLISYATGTYVNENGNTRGLQAVGVDEGDVTFESNKIKFTNGTNVAYMHAKESNGIYYVDNCGATATCGNDDHNFIIEVVTSLPVTISDAGYASWYAPVAVELPEDVEAWYFKGDITNVGDVRYAIMAPIGDNVNPVIVPANTGVILGGLAGNYELKITETETEIEGNLLKGTVATEYVTDNAYVLSKPNGKEIGFYLADMNKQNYTAFQNNSHKAYLPMDFNSSGDAQQSAGFVFRFSNNTTAIEEVETESSDVNAIYDLTGRKLSEITKPGIYIVNGNKVIVR